MFLSILKRLGIDESVDYTKPLVDPSVVPMPPKYSIPPRSRSVSSDLSEDAAKSHISNSSSPALPDTKDESKSPISRTKSPAESDGTEDNHEPINKTTSGGGGSSNNNNSSNKKQNNQSSLSALSSMFESIGGTGDNSSSKNSSSGGFPSNSHHPLAALQKLCDKTENTPQGSVNSRPTSTSSSNPQSSPGYFKTIPIITFLETFIKLMNCNPN